MIQKIHRMATFYIRRRDKRYSYYASVFRVVICWRSWKNNLHLVNGFSFPVENSARYTKTKFLNTVLVQWNSIKSRQCLSSWSKAVEFATHFSSFGQFCDSFKSDVTQKQRRRAKSCLSTCICTVACGSDGMPPTGRVLMGFHCSRNETLDLKTAAAWLTVHLWN